MSRPVWLVPLERFGKGVRKRVRSFEQLTTELMFRSVFESVGSGTDSISITDRNQGMQYRSQGPRVFEQVWWQPSSVGSVAASSHHERFVDEMLLPEWNGCCCHGCPRRATTAIHDERHRRGSPRRRSRTHHHAEIPAPRDPLRSGNDGSERCVLDARQIACGSEYSRSPPGE